MFSNTAVADVPQIVHPPGMDYRFDENITHHWCWQEMVAQLVDADMRKVVVGESNDDANRSLIRCMIEKSGVYDHKRHFAARQRNEELDEDKYVWNFVLERDDGSLVSLHPNFKGPNVECQFGGWRGDDGERPGSGKGGTSGKGTYRHFATKYTDVTLRFDARKNGKGTPQSRSRPASRSTA